MKIPDAIKALGLENLTSPSEPGYCFGRGDRHEGYSLLLAEPEMEGPRFVILYDGELVFETDSADEAATAWLAFCPPRASSSPSDLTFK
jgi:hypothetical protein